MRNFNKNTLMILVLFSVSACAQQLTTIEKEHLTSITKNSNRYEEKTLKTILKSLPEVKMLRIMPNNPDIDIHTFIFGFVNNDKFSKSSNNERITLFVKGHLSFNNLLKEDISTELATKKYGELVVIKVLK